MGSREKRKPELLAPAGTLPAFEKAIEAGADAVYIGAPALHARALAKDFSLAEIAAMITFARSREVKLYLAANSLLKESEIPQAMETLAILAALQPDALIIQDLGIYHLCRKYFPQLQLHASTLLGAHNSLAVRQFQNMGFKRVVLARELTLREINTIATRTDVELETFVHGALCFSYSGLCLFSSYLGGKSGLRGSCVQPCRRRYSWGERKRQPGYFFSMNDLQAVEMIHKLAGAGVGSFKIEGRLRSAHYVAAVVRAYRRVIDAPAGDTSALQDAGELLAQAMGRKTGMGYFSSPGAKDLITPHHSGNIGSFLGRAGRGSQQGRITLHLRQPLQTGDRLRLHQEETGERIAFTLRSMILKGRKVSEALPGDRVTVGVPAAVKQGDSLFKVDSRAARAAEKKQSTLEPECFSRTVNQLQSRLRKNIAAIQGELAEVPRKKKAGPAAGKKAGGRKRPGLPLYWKVDDLRLLKSRFPMVPELFLVELNRKTLADFQRLQKPLKRVQHKIAWCLPPVLLEGELDFFRKTIESFQKKRFVTWQIAHIGQRLLFSGNKELNLLGDYTVNVLNSAALPVLASLQLQRTQAAIEIDRQSLADLAGSPGAVHGAISLGMTVYGTPPLFTARPMLPHFHYNQPFTSPKGEVFTLRKAYNSTVALADKPFSLLSRLPELARLGLQYGVIDLCHRKVEPREIEAIGRELAGRSPRRKFSTFNYLGTLQ
jgi:putative protease